MGDLSQNFGLARVVILTVVSVFSALVLIMGALVTDFTTSVARLYFNYAAFSIAISILTILTVPVLLFISIHRKGALPSMVVVELGYFGLLWILWLAVAGTVVNVPGLSLCAELGYNPAYSRLEAMCRETQAMAAFAFLNWMMLMGLNIFLLVLAIIQAHRGNSAIWTSCVTDVNYSAPGTAAPTDVKVAYTGTPSVQYPQSVPSPQPQVYPPQQVYTPQQPYSPQQVYTPQPQQAYTPQPQQAPMPMSAQI